jgi:Cu(I)/Ag(I) efflux system membrane fusion protein
MNRLPAIPLLALLLVTNVTLGASEPLKAIVASYLDIHGRLFRDNMEGIKQAAAKIQQQAAGMGTSGGAIAKAAKSLEAAPDLKTARDAFGALSDAVIAAGDAEGWKDLPDIKQAYCPMAKKPWLQRDESIRNPYFGPAMPTCGEFKKK